MSLLLLVSFVWAFSYGLIGSRMAGLDTTALATLRLALSLVTFLPFFRTNGLSRGTMLRLMGIGAAQFGLMYLLYQRSYLYLPSHTIVLFTLTTPLYVALCDALVQRQVRWRYLLAALLALAGAATVTFQGSAEGKKVLTGFVIMQLSNLCFGAGQIAWRRERARLPIKGNDASLFALPYLGAVVTAGIGSLFVTDWSALHPTTQQWLILVYLGVLSSGVCFFWWNLGATRVNAGTLAVFNNAKVPLGVACSLLFFGEHADLLQLVISGALMLLAVWIAERK